MVNQNLSLHTPRNVIQNGLLAFTLTFTHLDVVVGVEPDTAGVQTEGPSSLHLKIKIDCIKQNYKIKLFYSWDPQDDKSEQYY